MIMFNENQDNMKKNQELKPYLVPETTITKVETSCIIAGSDQIDPIEPGTGGED